jgi:PhnB protein
MASHLNPYISFNGDAREAMEFYRSVFGGELSMNTFGEFGQADQPGADKIMHAQLVTEDGYRLMGADTPPGLDYQAGNTMTVSVSGDDADRLRGFWEKLSASGTVTMPLEKQMWGDEFGMCTDPYGVAWMVNISQPAA